MTELRIGADMALPLEAVTQTFAIFGKRGSGKSNGATVLAEEMIRQHIPVVILDPLSAWWGLKSSFDGEGAGLPVYVFGGQHGDLPLEPAAGQLMADVFVEHRLPMVLDMKGWSGGERSKFVTAFALRLLDKNDRVPVHVFMEEADAFIPQRPYKGEEQMLGAMDRLVRWGRQEGIGATLITQRSAKVNKDVTTQAETLVAFRTTGPQDRDAIDNWIRYHAGDDVRQEVLQSLPTLPDGTAWVWSPEWLDVLEKVAWRRRQTFDSASTPKVGEKRVQPKKLADVDLEQLRGRLAATIEKVKADDPKELRRRIAELEREVKNSAKSASSTTVEVEKVVEVPVMADEDRHEVEGAAIALEDLAKTAAGLAGEITALLDGITEQLKRYQPRAELERKVDPRAAQRGLATARAATGRLTPPPGSSAPIRSAPKSPPAPESNGAFRPSGSQQRILDSLVWLETVGLSPASRTRLALLVGLRPTSGGFKNYLGSLRSAGMIDYPTGGQVALTDTGRAHAAEPDVAPTPESFREQVYGLVGGSQRRILEALVASYPEAIARDDLAPAVGLEPTSGGFKNYLGQLRTLGLIDYPQPGWVAAEPVLFLEGG